MSIYNQQKHNIQFLYLKFSNVYKYLDNIRSTQKPLIGSTLTNTLETTTSDNINLLITTNLDIIESRTTEIESMLTEVTTTVSTLTTKSTNNISLRPKGYREGDNDINGGHTTELNDTSDTDETTIEYSTESSEDSFNNQTMPYPNINTSTESTDDTTKKVTEISRRASTRSDTSLEINVGNQTSTHSSIELDIDETTTSITDTEISWRYSKNDNNTVIRCIMRCKFFEKCVNGRCTPICGHSNSSIVDCIKGIKQYYLFIDIFDLKKSARNDKVPDRHETRELSLSLSINTLAFPLTLQKSNDIFHHENRHNHEAQLIGIDRASFI